MRRFRWGIFGTGTISAKFVAGLAASRGAEVSFVASRSLDKAQAFAHALGIKRAIQGYAEAAAQGGVDAIYIATPPTLHEPHALACIQAGIPILVEKPFASSERAAQQIANAARAKSVFAMEAMWTRFLPAAQEMKARLAAAEVGAIRLVTGNFGISHLADATNGMFDPAVGGGALAHLGPYPLSLAQWMFGTPTLVGAAGAIGATGVDEDVALLLQYDRGVIGSFHVSLRSWAPDDFALLGEGGMIRTLGSIVRPHALTISREPPIPPDLGPVFGWKARLRQTGLVHGLAQRAGRSSRGAPHKVKSYYKGNGYHYEADEVSAQVARGSVESPTMPLNDSVSVARTIEAACDALHQQGSGSRNR